MNSSKLAAIFILLSLSACSKAPEATVTAENFRTNEVAVDSMISSFRVVRSDQLLTKNNEPTLLTAESGAASKFLQSSREIDERTVYQGKFPTEDVLIFPTDVANDTLILGLPIDSLGEERVFGGVITSVSNGASDELGNLKLSDIPMVHGKLMLAALNTNEPQLIVVGCAEECKESSPRVPQLGFPIVAVDTKNNLLMLDISAVGKQLDMIRLMDPLGVGTGLKSVSTVATKFDYSQQTVVFDVESKLTALDPAAEDALPDTNISVRWYLKSMTAFDPAFEAREATPGVGFFMTDRAATPKIKRWSLARFGDAGIKYYLKHIPKEWQAAFASSFDEWNDTFVKILGRKIFDYEFIPEGDVRNDLIVTGDIRYNVVEWDLVNKATYGGLGPSFANEHTGEDLSTNVLIQGPTIMTLYSDWYKVGAKAQALIAQGKAQEADLLLRDYSRDADAKLKASSKHVLTLNKKKAFRIHSETPALEDPLAQRNDFEELPPNVDFTTYMNGYFHDMLTHELGHNLGLRHNFRGNIGATDTGAKGSTSRSVMEYLGRRYRYLDGVGEYDVMALQYGYGNVKPSHLDWFCTDEDGFNPKKPASSAECTPDDATSDPFTYFEFRLSKVMDNLLARGQSYAPVWTLDDMARESTAAMKGLLSYSLINEKNALLITNFFGKTARPADEKSAQAFVVARIKQQLCDPNLANVIAGKYDPAAQKLTQSNLLALREKVLDYFQKGGVNIGFDVTCN